MAPAARPKSAAGERDPALPQQFLTREGSGSPSSCCHPSLGLDSLPPSRGTASSGVNTPPPHGASCQVQPDNYNSRQAPRLLPAALGGSEVLGVMGNGVCGPRTSLHTSFLISSARSCCVPSYNITRYFSIKTGSQKAVKMPCMAPNVCTKVPDGGWGWIIAFASFFVQALTDGFIKSFGIFFNDLMESFGETTSRISWIISICVFVQTFTAPLSAVLSNRFGHGLVVVVGGVMVSTGTAVASFAHTVVDMYVAVGVVSGLGYSLCYLPTVTALSQYFDRRRLLVTTVASTGECFAVFFFAPAITALKEHIGWRHSLLSVGVLQLIIVACGLLLKPIIIKEQEARRAQPSEEPTEMTPMLEKEQTGTSTESIGSEEEITALSSHLPGDTKAEPEREEPKAHVQILIEDDSAPLEANPKLLDFSVMKDYSFICYALFGMLITLGFLIPSLYIIPLSLSLGISQNHSAYVLSAVGIAEVFGRISAGCVLNRKPLHSIYVELICVILLSVALSTFPFASSFCDLVACSLFLGFTLGTVAGTHVALLAEDDVVGIAKMPSAVGIYLCFQSLVELAAPPLAGVLVERTKSYSSAFFSCATGVALAAVFLSLVRPCKAGLCHRQQQRAEQRTAEAEPHSPDGFMGEDMAKAEHLGKGCDHAT
ncbi:monocarboxylate transporter 7-like [Colius striatus]|uniref:monocarboxylate transporter 7-like n=1 Tax=Colius striatus TaxID=57412 RepID=UPI002B1D80CC|nr:monocarboxylate transporter 7-like [Colius striatus]